MDWISVNDKLPDKIQKCIVTVLPRSPFPPIVCIATYVPDLETWDENTIDYYDTKSAWMSYDEEDDCYYKIETVKAWMPFPKPYKEGS